MKIVINTCFGGFSLSDEAENLYSKLTSRDKKSFYSRDIERDDPKLIQVVEELGKEANGLCADLSIVEIPDGVNWEINEYDGNETIHEVHRSWR